MLFGLIESDLADLGSIESDSDSVADYDAWQEEFGQQGLLDVGQGSAEWSLLGSILLDPSRLDISGSN